VAWSGAVTRGVLDEPIGRHRLAAQAAGVFDPPACREQAERGRRAQDHGAATGGDGHGCSPRPGRSNGGKSSAADL